jgi:hypothetical protein
MSRCHPLHAFSALIILAVSLHAAIASAQSPEPTPQQRAEMLKSWMAASKEQLHAYQWHTETVITVDGEKKSDVTERCFYGPEGQVQKVSMGDSVEHSGGLPGILPPGRLIKMIQEHKQEEMKTYINNAVTLLHSYVPPSSTDIQAAIHAGLMSVNVLEPGAKVELVFKDFKKQGDQLGVEIALPENRLLGLSVKTYVDSPDDPVDVQVTMAVMPNGTIYTQNVLLTASAKKLEIAVTNSDYQRISQ